MAVQDRSTHRQAADLSLALPAIAASAGRPTPQSRNKETRFRPLEEPTPSCPEACRLGGAASHLLMASLFTVRFRV
jgi:hypothetical protein